MKLWRRRVCEELDFGIEEADESQLSTVTRIDSELTFRASALLSDARANLSLKRQDHYLLAVEIINLFETNF